LVVAELAVVAIVLAALSRSPVGWLVGGPVAAGLAILGFGRWRGRWASAWVGIAVRYTARPHGLPAGAGAGDLLALVEPGARLHADGVIESDSGFIAVLELGDPASLLTDTPLIVPPAGPDCPTAQVQLLVSGSPAPALRAAAGIPATSYRQLSEGRSAAALRAFLAVRVVRANSWSDAELRQTLAASLRKLQRRLTQEQVACRPLGSDALLPVLGELAHHDPGAPVRESWPGLSVGGLRQVCVRIGRFTALRPELAGQLVARLFTLPATATTVSIAATQAGIEVVVRIAAPTATGLATAVQALRRLVGSVGLTVTRLDGQQLTSLAATLPLAVASVPGPAGALSGARMELPGAGLVLGRNRRGQPVTVRLVRSEPTRALLVGGVRAAELVILRALALGIHVLIQTGRPGEWEPFLRAVSLPSDAVALIPTGRPVTLPMAGPLAPQLVVLDAGPLVGDPPAGEAGWRGTLVLRDDLGAADLDTLARADLVILQPLSPDEAALAGAALGLGDGQEWLARIGADMVGVVNRRTVRFARLTATPLEQQLIGDPERVATT
jgi:type VII secretion protein EccE